jgi:peptidoglycan/xylan/chitin deacetylase (PgdA/CDA1 family)
VSPSPPGTIVFRGPTNQPRFALTFDDGPSDCTKGLLDLLERRGVKATFFMVGSEVEAHRDVARAVRDTGHEIGLHSMAHLNHDDDADAALADVRDGADTIEHLLGVRLSLFRAPYGHFVLSTLLESERRGWTPIYWSAWGLDWLEAEVPQSIADRAIADLAPGAIVLLHDGRFQKPMHCSRMLEALELILDEAEQRGLEPVTVGELLGIES